MVEKVVAIEALSVGALASRCAIVLEQRTINEAARWCDDVHQLGKTREQITSLNSRRDHYWLQG